MFAKLLKHEFRATRNAMWVLCLTALGAGVLGGCAMGYLMWASTLDIEMNFLEILCVMTMIFSMIGLGVCGVGALLLMVGRFYKSRFTDEGYLTFTLPVTTHQVLLSSLVSSGLNMLLTFVTVFVSFIMLLLVGMSFAEEFWPTVWEMLPQVFDSIKANMSWEVAGYLAVLVADMLLGLAYELVLLMLSVTIGSLVAKNHKILAAVGVYYGINMAMSIAFGIFLAFIMLTVALDNPFSVFIFQGILFALLTVAGYFLMHYLVSRKLNLP